MKFSIILLSLFILVGSPLEATFAKEDPALRKQRQEAKKERHQQKRDRGTELTEARRSLQDFARSQKSDYTQQLQDLDVDFELKEVELTANRDSKMAEAEVDYQKQLMGYFTGAQDLGPEGLKKMQAQLQANAEENFRIKLDAAKLLHEAKLANQQLKNELLNKRDQEILDEAESLGLTQKPSPILAKPIGGELTKSEQQENARAEKDVGKINEQNKKLLKEYTNGKAIREWELTNIKEDFTLKWQEKAELHKVSSNQMFYNSLMMPMAQGGEIDREELMDTLAELNKETKLIKIKYAGITKKNQITRRQELKALRDK